MKDAHVCLRQGERMCRNRTVDWRRESGFNESGYISLGLHHDLLNGDLRSTVHFTCVWNFNTNGY